jgi:glycosyltransferase involved in cell wall biosynthesis
VDDPNAAGRRVGMLVLNPFTHDTRVEKEAASLISAGYGVTVVAEAAPGLALRERRDGIDVVRVQRSRSRLPGLRLLAYARQMERELVAQRPDLLHAHDSNALLSVARAARRLRVPFVYDAHDLWTGRPRRGRSRLYFAASQLYFRILESRLLPRAAAHLTVSRPIARYLERTYGLPAVTLVPNYPLADREVARRELRSLPGAGQIPKEAATVLYLGGLMAERGIEQLVRAMAELPAAHLVLLGDGALSPAIRRLAADLRIGDRVHLLAPVPSEEVVAYAASATIGVSPIIPSCLNYRYSLPNKLFQYMAAGIPVVASDFEQVREVVLDHDAGLTVDMTDPAVIASAIGTLLADPAARKRMGANAREAVATELNWGRSAEALLGVYRSISRDSAGDTVR